MNIGDFVKTTKEIYGSPLRQCGLIVGFDIDDDPIVRWFSTGKAWDEENYRKHLILCSSVNEKGDIQCP
jgi:hypothetical protein